MQIYKITNLITNLSYIGKNENETIMFNSQQECLKFLNVKGCSGLLKAIKNHNLYHGYYWEVGKNE